MWATFIGGFLWMVYLALEPYVRRRWPQSMITWSRLLRGGFRDPLVGGQLLAGIALGIGNSVCRELNTFVTQHYGPLIISTRALNSAMDTRRMTGEMLSSLTYTVGSGLFVVFLFFLFRVLLRRQWLTAAIFILLVGGAQALADSNGRLEISAFFFIALGTGFFVATLLRFGVLPAIFYLLMTGLPEFPLTTDLSAWYAGSTVVVILIVLALTAYAFHTAVAGRPLFKEGFLESS